MDQIPHDILKEIFAFLDPIELFTVSMVCNTWNKVSSEDEIWMKYASKGWSSDLKAKYFQWLKDEATLFASGKTLTWMLHDDAPTTYPSLKERCKYTLKLILVGEYGVGKTSIFFRFAEDVFWTGFVSSVSFDFRWKMIELNGNKWRGGGGEMFRKITPSYYQGASGIIFVYDVSDRKSFEGLPFWFGEVEQHAPVSAVKILVGNKMDLNRVVSVDEAKEFAAAHGCRYFDVSAKTGENVSKAFMELSKEILPNLLPPPRPPSQHLFLQRVKVQEQRKKEAKKDKCVVS